MATKAIYTKINDSYYKVNQSTMNPSIVVRMPKTHSQMTLGTAERQVNSTIWINTIDPETVRSNRELYTEMINYLRAEKIEEVGTIQNRFIMFCDYSVIDDNGKVINHNIVTRALKAREAMYPLGVSKTGELVYKQVKLLEADINCVVRQEYPYGIMRNVSAKNYRFHLNDVAVYQDFVYSSEDEHNSTDVQGEATISEILKNMACVYSSHDAGMTVSAVDVPFIPRNISLNFHIMLDTSIVVYDDQAITDVLTENVIINNPGSGEIPEDEDIIQKILILNGGNATEDLDDDSLL